MQFQLKEMSLHKLKICLWTLWVSEKSQEWVNFILNSGENLNWLYDLRKVTFL